MFRSLFQNVSLIRLLLFTHLGGSVVAQSNLTCYNPDGTVNDYDTPCNPDAEVSHCCSSYALCLDNKLCFEQAYSQLNQGSCTERTWATSECFSNSYEDGSMCPGRKFHVPIPSPLSPPQSLPPTKLHPITKVTPTKIHQPTPTYSPAKTPVATIIIAIRTIV